MHARGIIVCRAVSRIAPDTIAPATRWTAAFRIANGLRFLFNRAEVNAVLDAPYSSDVPYWSAVWQYCADGNLQAVLDEYLFQLVSDLGTAELTAGRLLDTSQHAASVLSLRTVNYVDHDTDVERTQIRIRSRFSLRYGGRTGTCSGNEQRRPTSVRRSTARSPPRPRLDQCRAGGDRLPLVVSRRRPLEPAVEPGRSRTARGPCEPLRRRRDRRNVAAAHSADVVDSDGPNPWRAAFEAATRSAAADEYGHFAPWWVYPGADSIQRIVMEHPLSRDRARYERLRDSLAHYRLTLGQPRKEDMVELMKQRGVDSAPVAPIDLRPPSIPR